MSVTTSQILSATSAGLTGAREAFDKEVLVDRTIQAFVSQMRANRDQVKARILVKLTKNIDEYPFLAALSDLESYRQAGTLTGALNGISEAASSNENTAADVLESAELVFIDRQAQAMTTTARNLLAWLNEPVGSQEKDRRNELARECFRNADVQNKPPVFGLFLTDAGRYGDLEKAIVECLNQRAGANLTIESN